jgi:hypothetical protein
MLRSLFAPLPRRRRVHVDTVEALESRVLLSGASGQWLEVFTCPDDQLHKSDESQKTTGDYGGAEGETTTPTVYLRLLTSNGQAG